jgi:hypothetical protein
MTRFPGHEPLKVELPKLPWWMWAINVVFILIYTVVACLFIAALALGVWWLYGQVFHQ